MSVPESHFAAAEDRSTTIRTAFWNLQNLFSPDPSPIATDLGWTAVNGWDRSGFEVRIRNLAAVIQGLFDGTGPELLGLCEIEDARVAGRLLHEVGRSDLKIVVADPSQFPACGTALIYSDRVFAAEPRLTNGYLLDHRFPTCDLLEAHLQLAGSDTELCVLVTHWPSRRLREPAGSTFRRSVAGHCQQVVERLVRLDRREFLELRENDLSLHRLNQAWHRNILLMGCLNDEPWDISVREYLRSMYSWQHGIDSIRFLNGRMPSYRAYSDIPVHLFNPMWALAGVPDQGTCLTGDDDQHWLLSDQFVISRGLCTGRSGLRLTGCRDGIPDVAIERPLNMRAPSGRPVAYDPETRSGYSNHFPVTCRLQTTRGGR